MKSSYFLEQNFNSSHFWRIGKIFNNIIFRAEKKIMINLISDTVTKPTSAMLQKMMAAEVGDDVFRQDSTVNALEERMASMFGKEAALFCPSGTMTNQIAIKMHTQPLDEVICDHYSHVYQYETGGYAFNSGVAMNLITGVNGKITADQVEQHIRGDYDWLPQSRLVVLENSCNKGGGSYYTIDEIKPITRLCKDKDLKLHLDGARLFNVLVETQESTEAVGAQFDSISICLSKGLGAPVGSVLIGDSEDIRKARRFRKVMGGGMRQAGYLAAACLYALDHNVERLKVDNDRAKRIGKLLANQQWVKSVKPVRTNIVIFEVEAGMDASACVGLFSAKGIGCSAFGPQEVRFVFHLDISDEDVEVIERTLKELI
ncbi:MAG: threonine aldolase [Saprospiraceae bacterium]|jgi:threonine aldolase